MSDLHKIILAPNSTYRFNTNFNKTRYQEIRNNSDKLIHICIDYSNGDYFIIDTINHIKNSIEDMIND